MLRSVRTSAVLLIVLIAVHGSATDYVPMRLSGPSTAVPAGSSVVLTVTPAPTVGMAADPRLQAYRDTEGLPVALNDPNGSWVVENVTRVVLESTEVVFTVDTAGLAGRSVAYRAVDAGEYSNEVTISVGESR